jgi:trans-aconitate methyltransferase
VAEFDTYAKEYDRALAAGLSATGEDKNYFAHGRVRWLAQRLQSAPLEVSRVLDYGCGTGSAAPWLLRQFPSAFVVGVDISEASIAQAEANYGGSRTAFFSAAKFSPAQDVDLAFCNGVFHHIPIDQRLQAAVYVRECLRPGGMFAFWENNPWNPGTRYVMSRVPFDRDAVPLSAPAARQLMRSAGFTVLRTDFLFVFPRALRRLRWLERSLCGLPLGGQYLVLCQKPSQQLDS